MAEIGGKIELLGDGGHDMAISIAEQCLYEY